MGGKEVGEGEEGTLWGRRGGICCIIYTSDELSSMELIFVASSVLEGIA
jgi:hypothetical protein